MNKFNAIVLLIILQCFIQKISYGQLHTDSNSDKAAAANAISVYYQSLGEQSGIYNGPQYTGYPHKLDGGQPFFGSGEVSRGTIYYDGMLYKDIPMWYDLVKNEVVVLYVDNYSKISLHTEKIDYFSVFDHLFIHVIKDTANASAIPSGFYDIIYQGKSEVLVKQSKELLQRTTLEGIWITVIKQKNDPYLKKGDQYYPLKNVGAVMKALGSNQKEIQLYLKKNKIKFRKDPEKATVMIVAYYDQLND